MTSLKKITIEVGGKKLDFTPEEAKELKTILSDLFGGDKVIERVIERNRWHWWGPYITYTSNNYNGTVPNRPQIGTTINVPYSSGDHNITYSATGKNWSVQASPQSGYVSISARSKS